MPNTPTPAPVEPPSPPTDRVFAILDFLARDPSRRALVTQITRGTGLSRATCQRILDSLSLSGHVARRETDKSYTLGPALIALGEAARAGFGPLELARPLLEALEGELGVPWLVSTIVGDRIVVLDSSSLSTTMSDWTPPGTWYPFAPPWGVMYVAWDDEEAIARWMDRPPLFAAPPDPAVLRTVIDSCRSQGYGVERLSEANAIAMSLYRQIVNHDVPPSVHETVARAVSMLDHADGMFSDFSGSSELDVGYIGAPVFGEDGRPVLLISLRVWQEGVAVGKVQRYGQALVAAARRVTASLGGRAPQFPQGRGPAQQG